MAKTILKEGLLGQLRQRIILGAITPGSSLVEERLSEESNVSRTPVREAIRQLVYEGFAEYAPHCGARVVAPTPELIREVLTVREALEGVAAREAAVRIPAEELTRCRKQFEQIREAVRRGEFSDVGDEIHHVLFEASGNRPLKRMIAVYWGQVEWFQRLATGVPGRSERAFHEHDGILRALEAHDAAWAEDATRAHIRATLAELLKSIRDHNFNGGAA